MSVLHKLARSIRSIFIKEKHIPQKVYPFAVFPDDKQNWFVTNDKGIGGTSSGSIEVLDQGQGIAFTGKLALASQEKRMKTGYVALRLREFGAPVPFSFYDKLCFDIRGDNRNYVVTMRPVIAESHDQIFQTTIPIRNPGQWETVEVGRQL
eukprot:TRINITY_DN1714_c0_g1_i1.p1 TRINITY_DN1714_c0_g1~~TRINITY_DN1714_c0_g1_i1.p1  ORF type:complete len:151 (+),score=28.09 TRINITY_DN1714_c0_g1_i1:52-504(+)